MLSVIFVVFKKNQNHESFIKRLKISLLIWQVLVIVITVETKKKTVHDFHWRISFKIGAVVYLRTVF
jgi:hypothetical protein